MLITCPFCHKKVFASNRQLIFSGRPNLICPNCRRYLFQALRMRLLLMQMVLVGTSILCCARLGQLDLPGGLPGKIAVIALIMVLILVVCELCARWVSRPALLQQATDRLMAKEKAAAEAKRAAERKPPVHKKKK